MKKAFEQCIEFMYIGKADIRDDTAGWIATLSHILQLKPLEDMGLETMHHNLTTWQNCEKLRNLAHFCESKKYEAEAIKKWILIHLKLKPASNECIIKDMWSSVADLFQTSFEFKSACKILDALKIIQIDQADYNFLLEVVLMNENVNLNAEAASYIYQIIRQKINKKPSDLTTKYYYKVKYLHEKYGADDLDLKEILQKFMITNFNVLAPEYRFLKIKQDELISILSSPDLLCPEKTKYDSIVRWVRYDKRRARIFPQLFKIVKLQNLSKEDLITIRKNPLMEQNATLMFFVFDAMAKKNETSTTVGNSSPVRPDIARWVLNQRPEVDNSSNASVRSRRSISSKSSSNKISNFSTASLRESLLSLPTTTDSGAEVDWGTSE